MTPVEFAKGFLAQLSTYGLSSFNVHGQTDRQGLMAVHETFEKTVSSIKGNEAKSPRYRELLKIKNTLQPGVFNDFGAFCPALFEAMTALRAQSKIKGGFPIAPEDAPSLLEQYSPEDRKIVDASAKAFIKTVKIK